ncbi:MAG: hypothetical protein GYA33_06985, partial [Thermogutta sp.]|nr:hypothetical protein [Thermogutta sp.]
LNPEEDLQGERDGFLLRLDLPRPTSLEDLGTIDFLLVPDLAMGTAGPRLFRWMPARSGVLTVEALNVAAGEQLVGRLYDRNPLTDPQAVPLMGFPTPAGETRLDAEADAALEYFLYLEGDAADCDLRIASLLSQDAAGWTVFGTAGDDTFEVDAAAGVLAIQGVRYSVPGDGGGTLHFDGGPGQDVVILRDGPADDAVRILPGRAEWVSGVIPDVICEDFSVIHVYAVAGGRDTAELYDAPPDGGRERAVKFKSEPQYPHAKMVGPGIYHRVKFFEEVRAFASGGNDQAVLFGSPGDDQLEAGLGRTQFRGPGFDVQLYDFPFLLANASSGGFDTVRFYDSPLKDEFHGKAAKSEMFDRVTGGARYRITARYFDQVFARAGEGRDTASTGGADKAALWDTLGDDLAEVVGDVIRLYRVTSSGQRVLTHQVELFELAKLRDRSGGDDRIDEVAPPAVTALVVGNGWLPPE